MTAGTCKHNVVKDLEQFLIPVDELNVDANNARTHNRFNITAVMDSLREAGQRQPIVVQKKGMIVRAGNARLLAARELGWTHIAAIVIDESDEEAIKYAIRDNKTGLLGDWDYHVLSDYLKEFQLGGVELESLGFQQHELDVLLQAEFTPPPSPGNGDEGAEEVELSIRIVGDAVETVNRAMERCRSALGQGGADVTRGRLIELICAEYIAT